MSNTLIEIVKHIKEAEGALDRQAIVDITATSGDGYNALYLEYQIRTALSWRESWIKPGNLNPSVGQLVTFQARMPNISGLNWPKMVGYYFVMVDRATKWTKYQLFEVNAYTGNTKVPRSGSNPSYRYENFNAYCRTTLGVAFSHGNEIFLKVPDMENRPVGITDYTMKTPDTFGVAAQADGHLITFAVDDDSIMDSSLNRTGFFYWEVEQDDDSGFGSATTFIYGPSDVPGLIAVAPGTEMFYRARAVSVLGDLSNWTGTVSALFDPQPIEPEWKSHLYKPGGHFVTWAHEDISTVASYQIYRNTAASDSGATLVAGVNRADISYLIPYSPTLGNYFGIKALGYGSDHSATVWDGPYNTETDGVQDKFDGYGGDAITDLESLFWLSINSFENLSEWGDTDFGLQEGVLSLDNTYHVEREGAVRMTAKVFEGAGHMQYDFPSTVDFTNEGRFSNDDYLVLHIYTGKAGMNVTISFVPDSFSTNYYSETVTVTNAGHNVIAIKRSDFTVTGTPAWSNINHMWIGTTSFSASSPVAADDFQVYDDLRIVKADPDDPTDYNDTGNDWDKSADTGSDFGEWHIYSGNRTGEPSKPFSYGQIKTDASPTVYYLSHKPISTTNIVSGTIQAGLYTKGSNGLAGLSFFVSDVTPGSWDMYAVEADSAADTITLVKWVGGTRTVIVSAAFAFAPDQMLWLGVDFRKFGTDAGRLKVFASFIEGNLIQASNLIISTQDTALSSGGSVGVISKQANVRFVNFTAGSPAHAEVADVSLALDGPIISGNISRLWLRDNAGTLEKSTDGENFESAGGYLVGEVKTWSMSTLPSSEWLWCDGSVADEGTWPLLNAALIADGYPHGGSGASPLVPDARGRGVIAPDNMGGTSANIVTDANADTVGGKNGAETVTLATGEVPAHTHPFESRTGSGTGTRRATTNTGVYVVANTDSTGGGGAHSNMQPWIALPQIIYGGPPA